MPIQFTVSEKFHPLRKDISRKYYATARSNGELTYPTLLRRISAKTNLSIPIVETVIRELNWLIPDELANGKIVRMGELGSFCLVLKSKGEEVPEKVDKYSIEELRLVFKPGNVIKERLSVVDLQRVCKNTGS
jgi:predicted histone-like DNA-binding protein